MEKNLRTGDSIEILCHNQKSNTDEWLKGTFVAYCTALDIDFRINCQLETGQKIEGVHPDCVRTIKKQIMKAKILITIKRGNIETIVSNTEVEITVLDKDVDSIEDYGKPDSIMTDEGFASYKERETELNKQNSSDL